MLCEHLTTAQLLSALESGQLLLQCQDCGAVYTPARMQRYGDHACPRCDSTDVGRVTAETI